MALDGTSFSAALALANWSLYETKEEHDLGLPLLEAEHRRYMLSVPLQHEVSHPANVTFA